MTHPELRLLSHFDMPPFFIIPMPPPFFIIPMFAFFIITIPAQ